MTTLNDNDELTADELRIWQACLDVPELAEHYARQGITPAAWSYAIGLRHASKRRSANRLLRNTLLKLRSSEQVATILSGFLRHQSND